MINELKDKVIDGYSISRDEALLLADTPDSRLDELCRAADEIQRHFFDNDFDMCAVISVKGGRCSENCRYCAQSSCAQVPVPAHSMISPDELAANAQLRNIDGIRHYCLVSTGRRVSDSDIAYICEGISPHHRRLLEGEPSPARRVAPQRAERFLRAERPVAHLQAREC